MYFSTSLNSSEFSLLVFFLKRERLFEPISKRQEEIGKYDVQLGLFDGFKCLEIFQEWYLFSVELNVWEKLRNKVIQLNSI